MSLSDNPASKERKPPVRSIDAETNRSWSDKQKLEAVNSYLVLGNVALTARLLGIPEITIRVWKTKEWWKTAVAEIKAQKNIQLSSQIEQIVKAGLAVVEDRLANGDFIFDQKTGKTERKPVNMKDAHKVAVDLMGKQDVLEKTVVEEKQADKDEDRLIRLAEKFAHFVEQKSNKKIVEYVDVEVKPPKEGDEDALHDKWEA